MELDGKKKVTLLTAEEIQVRVEALGKQLKKDYADKKLLVISLLKGSFIFTADLVRQIDMPLKIEFMSTSSYGWGTESTGNINILKGIDENIEEYDVLIVDDIIDTGLTMEYVIDYLTAKKPRSIKSCSLLDKPSRRRTQIEPDYVGFEIPDKFIVGYGLNYGDYFRNVPYIFSFED